MYIIERLLTLCGSCDFDSSEYCLAVFFLNPDHLCHGPLTLREVEKETFISKSSINRFVKECGCATLKSFCDTLSMEYLEEKLPSRNGFLINPDRIQAISKQLQPSINKMCTFVKDSERLFLYGSFGTIHQLHMLYHLCLKCSTVPVLLSDWPIAAARRKLNTAAENDCLILVDPNYSLPMLKMRMDLQEEIIRYGEFRKLDCRKIFIGRFSSEENDGFLKITVPEEETGSRAAALLLLNELIAKRMETV